MSIHCIRRTAWLLPLLVFATPMLVPLAGRNRPKPPQADESAESPEFTGIVYHIIANEWKMRGKMQEFSPRVETYLQYYRPDSELGDVATSDDYFLGRLKFSKTIDNKAMEESFIPDTTDEWLLRRPWMKRANIRLDQFAVEPLVVDENNFDQKHYTFHPVRWEFLGNVRCLAIDVQPRNPKALGAFEGRIWVEDHDYAIVRLNGLRINPPRWDVYVHFDCWRENLQPGVWLPVYIYSQETDRGKRLRYKSETRFWGYDLTARHQQQEWTNIRVDAPVPVHDSSEHKADLTPVESQRQLNMEAERNVLDRLEKARLIAPPGPVDKVLETVVNNLKATNHLDNLPPVQCRIMLTSSLESFSLAYTIVLSRGLIDVLPDEPSLAMILAHELAHIALGQKLNAKYAFNDRMQVSDAQLLASLDIARNLKDEAAADAKGIEFLKNSPYQEKLGQAGLFLQAAAAAAPNVPCLFGTHLGNGLTEGNDKLIRMKTLTSGAPVLIPRSVDQIAALPLGSRLQVNPWDGAVSFATRKADTLVDASEKMPFRVTPVIPYLRPYPQTPKPVTTAGN
jgi:hypothetical protein